MWATATGASDCIGKPLELPGWRASLQASLPLPLTIFRHGSPILPASEPRISRHPHTLPFPKAHCVVLFHAYSAPAHATNTTIGKKIKSGSSSRARKYSLPRTKPPSTSAWASHPHPHLLSSNAIAIIIMCHPPAVRPISASEEATKQPEVLGKYDPRMATAGIGTASSALEPIRACVCRSTAQRRSPMSILFTHILLAWP